MLLSRVAYALAKTCLVLLGLALLGVEDKVEGGMREETTCMHVLCASTIRFFLASPHSLHFMHAVDVIGRL